MSQLEAVMDVMSRHPELKGKQLQELVKKEHGVKPSSSTICMARKRLSLNGAPASEELSEVDRLKMKISTVRRQLLTLFALLED